MEIMINKLTYTGEYLTLSIYLYGREPLKATFDVKFVDFTIIFLPEMTTIFKFLTVKTPKC